MAASMARQGLSPSGGSSSPSQVSNAISSGIGGAVTASGQIIGDGGTNLGRANRRDVPGYNPVNDSTSSVYDANAPITGPATTLSEETSSIPNTAPKVAQTAQTQTSTKQLAPTDQVPQGLADQLAQATSGVDQLKQKYTKAVSDIRGTGVAAPNNMGSASAGMAAALGTQPNTQQAPDIIGGLQETDSNFDSIFTSYDDYFSPVKQKQTLVQEYQAMSKALGLDSINAELINDKRIIEGTEDDIRSEVTAAGGFATDSQVQAMANARNKSLIKNYNTLLDTKNSLTTQLSTMMQLSVQDRQMAEAEFDRKLNFGFKVAEFKQKATDNARAGMKWAIENGGGAEILKSPYETQLTERTLGMPKGSLAGIVAKRAQESNLDARYKNAQIDKIYSDIGATSADNQVIVDQGGKVLLKAEDGRKLSKELVNSDSFKAINKAQDSLQFLNNFEESFSKFGATSAVFDPTKNSKMKAEYNAAILNLKEFFNLGVLNGPDEAILRGVLPDPTNRSNALRVASFGIYNPAKATENGIKSMKEMIETTLDDRFKTTMASYGDYSTQSVGAVGDTMRKYVDAKSSLNPEIKKMLAENPELSYEEVIEIISQ